MNKVHFGAGFVVFVLFFGISLLDAFRDGNWFRSIFWIGMGVVFLIGDSYSRKQSVTNK
jgi:hypothetical protein